MIGTRTRFARRFGNMRNEAAAIAQMNRSDAPINANRARAMTMPLGEQASRRADRAGTLDVRDARGGRRGDRELPVPMRDRAGPDQAGQISTRRVDRETVDPYYGTPRRERRPEWRETGQSAAPRMRSDLRPRNDEFRESRDATPRMGPAGGRESMQRERVPSFNAPVPAPVTRQAPAFRSESAAGPSPRSAPISAPNSRSSDGERSGDKR